MSRLAYSLWHDIDGAIVSAEVVLVATILVIGLIPGLTALRDAVIEELADVAQAISNINQSFSYSGVSGHYVIAGGGGFSDALDVCDAPGVLVVATPSKCIVVGSTSAPYAETGGAIAVYP